MAASENEIKIKVGFGDTYRDLTVRIAEGDIPPYEPGARFDVIGSAARRLDAEAKVSGRARYTYDQNPAGLLAGKILRCPHPNANVKSVDLTVARAMPGVKAAISFPEVFHASAVRYAWEGVAAVAAETETQAEAALRAIKVEYEVLPFCVTREDSMKPGAPQVGRRNQQNVRRIYPEIPFNREGAIDEAKEAANKEEMRTAEQEVDGILKEADHVVEGTFYTQVQTHSPLETHGVVCSWENDALVCHCSTQATFAVRHELQHPRGAVRAKSARVLCEYVGGGFGAKFGAGREGVAGALLAKEAGRPVKLMLDRREEHTTTGNRPDSHQVLTLAVAKSGVIRALRARSWGTAGTSPGGAGAHNDVMYDLGTIDKVEYGVRTNANDARPLRAPGFPQGVFALEGMMDMAADAIGMDPIEFRKKNDTHPVRRAEYDIARERIGWQQKFSARPAADAGPIRRGVGCASSLWFAQGGGGAKVLVRIFKNGGVEVRSGAQDIGTGTRTILGMVVAEELGIAPADVATFIGDTNDPPGPGSGGSTTAPTLTPAARLAAHRAKRQLLDFVGKAQGWDPSALDIRSGGIVRRDGAKLEPALDFRKACWLMNEDQIDVLGERPVLDKDHPNYEGLADTNAGVQCAEVEVDTETGLVRVLEVVAVADAGKLINPKLAESQVRGGVIQGVSYALYERRIMDRMEGRMLNADFEFYKILGAADCPQIDVVLLDVFMGHNNTHVMGLGEPPVVATAAAVANAVARAIGRRIHSLPITPRKVLAALAGEEVRG